MAADELFSALQDENTESRRNAIEIVQDRGLTSVQEELSRPALVQDEGTMLLHMAIASLDLSLGATLETIDLQRSSNERSSTATFEAAATALKVNILKTGCKSIDHILGGGILVNGGSIIEISGKAGVGKTQLAMQIALMATAPLLHGGLQCQCIYTFIEGRPPIKRMSQIERALCSKFKMTSGTLLHGVVVETIRSADELLVWSETRLPYLLRKTEARVVVIDSIAAVYRPEFKDALSRTRHMAQTSAALKRATAAVQGVCVCLNQVSQKVDSLGFGKIVPALGSVWGNTVETRVFLRRSGTHRFARIMDSAHLYDTEEEREFQICQEGVIAVDEG